MANRIKREDRKICVATLCFTIPIRLSISLTKNEWDEYINDCKIINSAPPLLRLKRKFFEEYKVNNSQQLPYAEDDEIQESYHRLTESFIRGLGPQKNKFINWVRIDKNKVRKLAEEKNLKNEKTK